MKYCVVVAYAIGQLAISAAHAVEFSEYVQYKNNDVAGRIEITGFRSSTSIAKIEITDAQNNAIGFSRESTKDGVSLQINSRPASGLGPLLVSVVDDGHQYRAQLAPKTAAHSSDRSVNDSAVIALNEIDRRMIEFDETAAALEVKEGQREAETQEIIRGLRALIETALEEQSVTNSGFTNWNDELQVRIAELESSSNEDTLDKAVSVIRDQVTEIHSRAESGLQANSIVNTENTSQINDLNLRIVAIERRVEDSGSRDDDGEQLRSLERLSAIERRVGLIDDLNIKINEQLERSQKENKEQKVLLADYKTLGETVNFLSEEQRGLKQQLLGLTDAVPGNQNASSQAMLVLEQRVAKIDSAIAGSNRDSNELLELFGSYQTASNERGAAVTKQTIALVNRIRIMEDTHTKTIEAYESVLMDVSQAMVGMQKQIVAMQDVQSSYVDKLDAVNAKNEILTSEVLGRLAQMNQEIIRNADAQTGYVAQLDAVKTTNDTLMLRIAREK